jgi:phenylacetate-CoA ligase
MSIENEKYNCNKNSDKLHNIVKYAYTNVLFYMNILEKLKKEEREAKLDIPKNINEVPVISKMMIEDEREIMSIEYMYGHEKEKMKVETSGSTGKCMEIFWDKKDYIASMLPLWLYRYKYYNIKTDDRFCYFYTLGNSEAAIAGDAFYEETKNALGFSKSNLTNERLLEICRMMKEYKPVWINTQPSVALSLAECFRKNNLERIEELKYIELTGEMLFDNVRKEIEKIFGCRVANQYGCYEANSIAYECPYGNMHCMEDNIYVEVLDESGNPVRENEEGNIVITTLNSHTMPFIRYKTGDMGIVEKNISCKCGNHSPILKLISGRTSDYAVMKDGSRVSSYVFVRAVELVNRQCENIIRQFRIIQKDYDYFVINLVLDEEVVDAGIREREVEDVFLQMINDERLYETEFEFQYFEGLELEKGERKLRYFVREIKK